MKKIVFSISLMVLYLGCSSRKADKIPERIQKLKNLTVYPIDVQPVHKIILQRQLVYGNTDQHPIGNLSDVAVDSSGHVYIADGNQNNIKIYKPNGQFIKQLGRKGKGPGEFTMIWNIQIKDQKLFAENLTDDRVNIFNQDSLKFFRTVNLARNKQEFNELHDIAPNFTNLYVKNDGSYLVEFTKSSPVQNKKVGDKLNEEGFYYFLDKNGNIMSEKLFEAKNSTIIFVPWPPNNHPSKTMGITPEFYRNSMTVLSGDNHIFWATPDYFLIKVYSPSGKYQRAIYYPYKKVLLTPKSASEAGIPEFLVKNMESLKLPRIWPALNDMKIDDQTRLWVSTIFKNMKAYQWWVLNKKGKLLARFTWPRDKPIQVIKNGYVYTKEKNKNTGVEEIVRYKIEIQ